MHPVSRSPRACRVIDTQDWQFSPIEFAKLSEKLGGFTLDAAADALGHNAQCDRFCSAQQSLLHQDLQGERVWTNFSFARMAEFLQHYRRQKAKDPSLCGAFVVPTWTGMPWWQLVSQLPVVLLVPTGVMWTLGLRDGMWWCIGIHLAVILEMILELSLAGSRDRTRVVDSTCREGSETGHSALCDGRRTDPVEMAYEHGPTMSCSWDGLDHSMPPTAEAPTNEGKSGSQIAATPDVGILDRVDGSGEWPELLQAHGHVAGISAVVFMDSGSRLNVISMSAALERRLHIEPCTLQARLPGNNFAPIAGVVRNVSVRLGNTYTCTVGFHVMDLLGCFNVILGKGWHDAANPQICWPKNEVQIYEAFMGPHRKRSREEKVPQISCLLVYARECRCAGCCTSCKRGAGQTIHKGLQEGSAICCLLEGFA